MTAKLRALLRAALLLLLLLLPPLLTAAPATLAAPTPSALWPTSHHDNRNSGSTGALGPGADGACLSDVLPPGALAAGAVFGEPGVSGSANNPDLWFAGSSDNTLWVGRQPAAGGDWGAVGLKLADVWGASPPPNYPATPFGVLTSPVAIASAAGGPGSSDVVVVASGDGYVYALNAADCVAQGRASAACAAWPQPFGSSVPPPLGPQGFFSSPRFIAAPPGVGSGRGLIVVAESSAVVNANAVWHALDAGTGMELWSVAGDVLGEDFGVFGIEPCIDDAGPHPDLLFLQIGTNIAAFNLSTGAFLDNGGEATGDPLSSSCTCNVSDDNAAVYVQTSGPRENSLFRFNLDANKPDGKTGRGFYSYYGCGFTPGATTCTRRAEPPSSADTEAEAGARSAAGGFFQPTTRAQRDELLAELRDAFERAHGRERMLAAVGAAALAGRPALQAAALARALPLETINAIVTPSGYRRAAAADGGGGGGRRGRGAALPSGFMPTAVPTLTADAAEMCFPQHNPSAPFTTAAQVPAGAIFFADDSTHVVRWQLRGVGIWTADFSEPFYSVASSASSVAVDAAGIGYAGADLNNNWRVPYPPYAPGDPQVNRTAFPVSGAPSTWSVPAMLAFNVSTGALVWVAPLASAGAGAVADDSPTILAPAGGASGPGILLITSPDPQRGGVIAVSAGRTCPSADPLFACSGKGTCDACGAGTCSCDADQCAAGPACADALDCGAGGLCTPGSGAGGCVCSACWLKDALGACSVPQTCSGHGSCRPADGVCDCVGGYTGPTCATPPAPPSASASPSPQPAGGNAAAPGASPSAAARAAGVAVPLVLAAAGALACFLRHPRARAARERARALAHALLPAELARAVAGEGALVGGRYSPVRVEGVGAGAALHVAGETTALRLGAVGPAGGGSAAAARLAAAAPAPLSPPPQLRRPVEAADALDGARRAAAAAQAPRAVRAASDERAAAPYSAL